MSMSVVKQFDMPFSDPSWNGLCHNEVRIASGKEKHESTRWYE